MRWAEASVHSLPWPLQAYLSALLSNKRVHRCEVSSAEPWDHVVLVQNAEESQFDALNRVVRVRSDLTEALLCVAGVGKKFHGFKNRPWQAARGNLHLSAVVSPHARIDHSGVAFTVLAVVSVLQTLDDLGALPKKAAVKWVNDIMIENAKVGGVLSSAQIQGDIVTHATVGIGLNIEKSPSVSPTPFVPLVGSLHQHSTDPSRCTLRLVFQRLIMYLGANYRSLLAGGYPQLLEFYRSRSLVLGRPVRLYRDSDGRTPGGIFQGVVSSIGDDLELFLDQAPAPVLAGRLELLSN